MAQVKSTYYANVERIKERFPDKEWLRRKDVANFLGVDEKTVSRRYPLKNGGITVATLASCLSV